MHSLLQVHVLCGHLAANSLRYGALYTDQGFWFAEYDACSDTLRLSEAVHVAQVAPITAAAALLYAGSQAVQWARGSSGSSGSSCSGGSSNGSSSSGGCSGGSSGSSSRHSCSSGSSGCSNGVGVSRRGFFLRTGQPSQGGPQGAAAARAQPTGEVWLGPLLGWGGTGSVHEGRLPDLSEPVAIKVADAEADAEERLLLEELAFGALHAHQGAVVPRLLAAGTLQVPGGGAALRYLAMSREGPSLTEHPGPLLPEQEAAVTRGLHLIHGAGVLHGDIRPANVVLPGTSTCECGTTGDGVTTGVGGTGDGGTGSPLWLDFGHAELLGHNYSGMSFADSCASEDRACAQMLEMLRSWARTRARMHLGAPQAHQHGARGQVRGGALPLPPRPPPPRGGRCCTVRRGGACVRRVLVL